MLIINGREYARVTEVLAKYSDYSHIDPEVLRRKCDIGTDIHAAIADHLSGSMPMPCQPGAGYFDSYMLWYRAVAPRVIYTETRYCCDELMITGQIDLVCTMGCGDIPVLIDFKTSVSESPVWIMQAHLYAHLLQRNNVIVGDKYIFLKLDKLGRSPIAYTYTRGQNTLNKCLNACRDFWAEKKK